MEKVLYITGKVMSGWSKVSWTTWNEEIDSFPRCHLFANRLYLNTVWWKSTFARTESTLTYIRGHFVQQWALQYSKYSQNPAAKLQHPASGSWTRCLDNNSRSAGGVCMQRTPSAQVRRPCCLPELTSVWGQSLVWMIDRDQNQHQWKSPRRGSFLNVRGRFIRLETLLDKNFV